MGHVSPSLPLGVYRIMAGPPRRGPTMRGARWRASRRGHGTFRRGMLFLLATHHPLSFDSRYYGAVPVAAVYCDLSAVP